MKQYGAFRAIGLIIAIVTIVTIVVLLAVRNPIRKIKETSIVDIISVQ